MAEPARKKYPTEEVVFAVAGAGGAEPGVYNKPSQKEPERMPFWANMYLLEGLFCRTSYMEGYPLPSSS